MANNKENLQPIKSKQKARELGHKGGIASGVAKREKKILTNALKELLKEGDTVRGINMALLTKALTGDTKAYEVIRDTIGEKPTDKQEVDYVGATRTQFITKEDIAETKQHIKDVIGETK